MVICGLLHICILIALRGMDIFSGEVTLVKIVLSPCGRGFCVLLEKGPTLKGNILGANCFLLEDILEVCVVQKSKQEVAKAVALVKMAEKNLPKKSSSLKRLYNPFIPNGLFYFYSLDRYISRRRGVWLKPEHKNKTQTGPRRARADAESQVPTSSTTYIMSRSDF